MASLEPGPSPVTAGAVPNRVFGPKGIQIRYTAATNLNYYENKSHTISLVIYQLNGLNAFNQQIKDGGRLEQAPPGGKI